MTFDEIKAQVEAQGNVKTVTMDVLRNAVGAGRLGRHVRIEISKTLAGLGIGHIPAQLPNSQTDSVRLYKKGTPVGTLIETVLNPSETKDQELVDQVSKDGPDYAAIVAEIRDLVSED